MALDTTEKRTLESIQARILWLATRMIDYANRERKSEDGLKVGGHQASSASMVTIMTALYFKYLSAGDRVSVKPHASPIFHAIQYLLGNLDKKYLTQLRQAGGLQSYPSRTKDPDPVDFSTGSVGFGAAAPLFAGLVRRYINSHFGNRPESKFIAIIGDAELDEGVVWEAVADPATKGLGNTLWIVDFNRQSLDRVIPGVRIVQWRAQFEAAGWHVAECKYGSRLKAVLNTPGSEEFIRWFDDIANEQYQSLFSQTPELARERFLEGAPEGVRQFSQQYSDEEFFRIITDLGGHDLDALLETFAECESFSDRPSVVFAYTIKGFGLPIAGDPRNHSAQISADHIEKLREKLGISVSEEWESFALNTPEGELCSARSTLLKRPPARRGLSLEIPESTTTNISPRLSTQEHFGRALSALSRNESIRPFLVTTAPDVATSTNLGGFINRVGVYQPTSLRRWNDDPVLKWAEGPTGQHIELGISEMNLFMLLGQLGLSWDHSGQTLIPIGTVYDPFVLRGLDAFIYSVYSGARFIVTGTPSGITLAPEGGAHQSTITPSVGMELPGVVLCEPAYSQALDWLFCDSLRSIIAPEENEDCAFYFRLTTRQIDQEPFTHALNRIGETQLRDQVLHGGYRLVESETPAEVVLVGIGAVMPEVLKAADQLRSNGIAAHVIDITAPGRLYRAWHKSPHQLPTHFAELFEASTPIISIHDGASHAMSWLGSALGVRQISLGVDEFGQSGSINDLYEIHGLSVSAIVDAAEKLVTATKK